MSIHNSNIFCCVCYVLCFCVSSNFRFGIYVKIDTGSRSLYYFLCLSRSVDVWKSVFEWFFPQADEWTKRRDFGENGRKKEERAHINIQHSIEIHKQRHCTQFKECERNKLMVFWLHFRCLYSVFNCTVYYKLCTKAIKMTKWSMNHEKSSKYSPVYYYFAENDPISD